MIVLFKNGGSIRIDHAQLAEHLEMGWMLDDPNYVAPVPKLIFPPDYKGMDLHEAEQRIVREMGL